MYEAEQSLWWYRGMEQISRRVIEKCLGPTRELKILDAGCGTGGCFRYLSAYGRVFGIDLSRWALHYCQGRGIPLLTRGSIAELPFPSNFFDLVTSFDVLCTLPGEEEARAWSELGRVLKPGGLVLLRLPACPWLRGAHDRAVDIQHRYTRDEVRRLLEKNGWQCKFLSYANMWLMPLAVVKRWSELLFPPREASDLAISFHWMNRLFARILSSEASLITQMSLPFGLTVVAMGKKNEDITA